MKETDSSFRHGLPESSAMDGNLPLVQISDMTRETTQYMPPWTLDFGIPAEMPASYPRSKPMPPLHAITPMREPQAAANSQALSRTG